MDERFLKYFSAKPIQTVPFTAEDPKEDMTEQQKLDYDIFMYEAAGNIQMANELRLKKIYGSWGEK